MPKDNIQSNEIVSYRLDMIEKRITTIENRLNSIVTNNNSGGSNEKINMELLNMLMSFIKNPLGDSHQNHPPHQPNHHDNFKDNVNDNINDNVNDNPANKSKVVNQNELARRIYSMQRLSTV